jgi:hypothetical protein
MVAYPRAMWLFGMPTDAARSSADCSSSTRIGVV